MARSVRWWVVAAMVACMAVGFVYLPPRPDPLLGARFQSLDAPSPYRLRVQELAARWRTTALELELLAARDRLHAEMVRRRTLELPGPALLFEGPESLPPGARDLVRAQFDSVWAGMELGVTKISVGVVLWVGRSVGRPDEPSWNDGSTRDAYLLPDSMDRTSCIVMLSLLTTWGPGKELAQPQPFATEALTGFLRNGLGPCAFHAAFGNPGHAVQQWLGARQYDLALNPWWERGLDSGRSARFTAQLDPDVNPWFWLDAYHYPPLAVACLAGRSPACRASVLAAAPTTDDSSRVVTTARWWQRQVLVGGDHYLADVVREVGRPRFQEFWNSEAPVDTALTAALRQPIGDWTRAWQARFVPRIRLGPSASLGASLLGVMLAALSVALVRIRLRLRECLQGRRVGNSYTLALRTKRVANCK